LLTRTLLPLIVETGPGRVVSITSTAQQTIDLDDVMLERTQYQGRHAYTQSKLAQILFTIDLAEALAGTGATANAVHPAVFMATTMVLSRRGPPVATIDEGADSVMQVITHPHVGTGQYYNQARPTQTNAQPYDVEARRRLHALAMELTGLN